MTKSTTYEAKPPQPNSFSGALPRTLRRNFFISLSNLATSFVSVLAILRGSQILKRAFIASSVFALCLIFLFTARSWAGCTTSGCHTADAAAALYNVLDGEVTTLVNVIWQDLNGNKALDAAPTDGGMLATIRATYPGDNTIAFCCSTTSDNKLSAAEGAYFNALMLGKDLYDHNDGSHGVHNAAFYKALLAATIQSLQTTYGLPAVRGPAEQLMQRSLSHPAVRFRTVAVRQ